MVKVSSSVTYTATGEQDLFTVPGDYVAYLKRLEVANRAAALATVAIVYYNGKASKAVKNLTVASNETKILAEDQLPLEACPTKISVNVDQQPVDVSFTVDLM